METFTAYQCCGYAEPRHGTLTCLSKIPIGHSNHRKQRSQADKRMHDNLRQRSVGCASSPKTWRENITPTYEQVCRKGGDSADMEAEGDESFTAIEDGPLGDRNR